MFLDYDSGDVVAARLAHLTLQREHIECEIISGHQIPDTRKKVNRLVIPDASADKAIEFLKLRKMMPTARIHFNDAEVYREKEIVVSSTTGQITQSDDGSWEGYFRVKKGCAVKAGDSCILTILESKVEFDIRIGKCDSSQVRFADGRKR